MLHELRLQVEAVRICVSSFLLALAPRERWLTFDIFLIHFEMRLPLLRTRPLCSLSRYCFGSCRIQISSRVFDTAIASPFYSAIKKTEDLEKDLCAVP